MNTLTQNYITVTSSLVTVRGIFQVILSYYDNTHKRKQKWKSLGIKDIAGNKNLAKKRQKEVERQLEAELNTPKETIESKGSSILFGEYIKQWLDNIKPSIELTTYASYKNKVETISEYFNNKGIKLSDLKRADVKQFYQHLVNTRNLKGQTIRRYHANIHKALDEAVELELISINPISKMKLDKSEQYIASYYNKEELAKLFNVAKGSIIELHILLAAYYGLRREEVCRITSFCYRLR
ncbi:MAG: phage integrase SAM-like domain-containing protein [Bacilli bacterium]|nr:phage integrase SAM-like domain-containing protein [Bacilli bacterium]